MEVLESALLAELTEFIGHIKSDWSARALVDGAGAAVPVRDESFSASLQALLRGKEGLDAAAVASSARHFLAGFKALFLCCAEADRRVAARAGAAVAADDDMDVDVDAATEDMDVDGRPTPGAQHHRQEGSGRSSCASAGSVAALFPSSGAKRKRASGGGAEVETVPPHKRRRVLAWMRPHQWLTSGSGRVSSAPRRSRHARSVALARSRIRRPIGKPDDRTESAGWRVKLAMDRIQRRMGKPPTTTRHWSQPSLGQHFSRIVL